MNNTVNSAVKIAVRERPARDACEDGVHSSIINYHPNGNNIIVNETVFTFDYALGPTVTQQEIFEKLIKPLIANLKQGFNCTALAYGQTGTGKSYTMGLNLENCDADDVGVIPRCLKEIFSMNDKYENQENNNNEISVSFIEIYNEKVYDLFGENVSEPIAAKGYKYTGGTRKTFNNLEDCYAILMEGNKNRHVRPTKMNSQSSRSHAIFTIHFRTKSNIANGEDWIISRMNIVDLAGSEGVRRTGHQGVAMSEGVYINQGLLSIGKVLQAITTGSKLIPYRDSVLSSVLQDSLNANSYFTLLACVSPQREDLSETLSTLRFAQNAKQMKNVPQINNILSDIKKNAKLKQTPYKEKPVQIKNARACPPKRAYSTLCRTQMKKSVKSKTFCTPKKKRIEIYKCNQTEICSNYNRPINLPKMNQLESTHNGETILRKSLESNGSMLSLNISTSTAIDDHANKDLNFSPIIRKCMAEFKNNLEDNLLKMLQGNLTKTPAPAPAQRNETTLASTIRYELKNILKEVLSGEQTPATNETAKQNQQNTGKSLTKCQLFNTSDDVFKIPGIPADTHGPKTSSPNNTARRLSKSPASFTQTFFANVTNLNNGTLNQSVRRSSRYVEKYQGNNQSVPYNNSLLVNEHQTLRRSSRKSVLQKYQNKQNQIRRVEETAENKNNSRTVNKSNKTKKENRFNNTIIDAYCKGSPPTSTSSLKISSNLKTHRKAILDLLNNGSMKKLQILPQIGQKTAYQIVTQRTLTGKFKNLAQVEKLSVWRGTAWERFAKANMLK